MHGAPSKIDIVVGARPNFMKAAPLYEALAVLDGLAPRIIHTGQHYDSGMSEIFFRDLDLPEPTAHLDVGSGTHAIQTAAILAAYEERALADTPDLVLVVGDVNSTVAAALVSAKLGIPVGHVEAGLRSGDRSMPEEINRIVTDSIADLHFVTEPSGLKNLRREGVPKARIHHVGNVMVDTLLKYLPLVEAREPKCHCYGLAPDSYGLVTLHRPSNVDDPGTLSGIAASLQAISESVPLVFPMHPRTRRRFDSSTELSGRGAIHIVEPLGYLDFLSLQSRARFVITDSGGVQEETTVLGIPCLTLRANTERPITLTVGTNRLVPLGSGNLVREVAQVMNGTPRRGAVPQLWDGQAASRIAAVVRDNLATGVRGQ